jgi:hypothetical protein
VLAPGRQEDRCEMHFPNRSAKDGYRRIGC